MHFCARINAYVSISLRNLSLRKAHLREGEAERDSRGCRGSGERHMC